MLTGFLNEKFFPLGIKMLRSAALLEIPREYMEQLNGDMADRHPYASCPCGSDRVFNYGIPRNNGRYFFCRICENSFKASPYQREWNEAYRTSGKENPTYDFWLQNYRHLIDSTKELPILDLGAGCGNDTIYLQRLGFNTISSDYSEEALRRLRGVVDTNNAIVCFDMSDGIPFRPNTFRIIIANLSLHYFSWHDTDCIIGNIRRALRKDGCLICRVNSTGDTEHGAGRGTRIENNYYDIGGKRKRFFDDKQLRKLFRGWETLYCSEKQLMRAGKRKIFWELVVRKQ